MPIAPWTPLDVADGLWTQVRSEDGVAILRSVALRLNDGTLAVVGAMPGAPAESLDRLQALGGVSILLAPNKFHNMGLKAHAERFGATIVGTEIAQPRLQRQSGRPVEGLEALRAKLPPQVRLLEPPGTRNGEVWLRLETGRGVLWMVGDAFFNVPRPPRGPVGWLVRAIGVTPGLRVGPTFRWIALRDAKTYAAWLDAQLAADRPAILVPSHGDVDDRPDLARRMRDAASKRLPIG